ncbi:MAG: FHA domain-containing protein [Lachnospiraceae bacterium]|nr:FHA domain-containing protein [Lachnospiraceae bacterium]
MRIIMYYVRKVITIVILFVCIYDGIVVRASEAAGIVEVFTGEESLTVYVKGVPEEFSDISVQIGTADGTVTAVQPVTEQDVSMKTFVMLDNSVSIQQSDREKVAELLQNLISDRDNNEEMAICVFGEDITWLTEYTADYSVLKQAVEQIVYQDQNTYLTDVLYDLLVNELLADREDIYYRIIIVSDGVDNKTLGYTKEELYNLLKENPYPIYTIGCTNDENEELENMFALSRITQAESFLLSDVENTLDITNYLKKDRNIVRVEIAPSPEVMDGSRKVVKLSFGGEGTVASLSADVVMPQQMQVAEEEQKQEEMIKEPVKPEIMVQESTEDRKPLVIIAAVCIAVAGAIGSIVLLVIKRRKKKIQFESIDNDTLNELHDDLNSMEKTEFMDVNTAAGDGNTYCIWKQQGTYDIVLTDIHFSEKVFVTTLARNVIVGRKKGVCDIVLDYDKSVSNRHCEISVRCGKFYINDLRSSNGTFINGSRITSEVEIFTGNIVKLGRLEMKFEVR